MEINMCGIIGYTGEQKAAPILIEGLSALEYRGYDSSGVALLADGEITAVKSKGRIAVLEEKLENTKLPEATCGIGHTRWATHGEPSDINAHPHLSSSLALVHNGIIENYRAIENHLSLSGYDFVSQTDTEAAAHLIDFYYQKTNDPVEALCSAADEMRGSFAFGVVFANIPDTIYAIRKDSPLIVAATGSAGLIASDITAILAHTNKYFRIDEGIVAVVKKGEINFLDREGKKVAQNEETVDWTVSRAQKSGFSHFMQKEIFEEPDAIRKTVTPRLLSGIPDFGNDAPNGETLAKFDRIHIVACGTAMHAGLIGKAFTERLARVPVNVEIASEFRYRDPILGENDLVILLSQSGETADTLAALRHAKARGTATLAIVNVIGSSVAREADSVIYTLAGPEIAVASTKAYSVQCAVLVLLAVSTALGRGQMSQADAEDICRAMSENVPDDVAAVLKMSDDICKVAKKYTGCEDLFYIGRGIDADMCTEGSLKLKEISYIHSEAYAAGELKHGTISLVTEGVPVVALITERALCEKVISAIREVKSRGARVLCIVTDDIAEDFDIPCDDMIRFPASVPELALFSAASVLQLFAYHAASARGLDVDKPRNLAKSVTVE